MSYNPDRDNPSVRYRQRFYAVTDEAHDETFYYEEGDDGISREIDPSDMPDAVCDICLRPISPDKALPLCDSCEGAAREAGKQAAEAMRQQDGAGR